MPEIVKLFKVKDMKCTHCKKIITNQVSLLNGIVGVDADLAKKQCKVTYDDEVITERNIIGAIRNLGYNIGK